MDIVLLNKALALCSEIEERQAQLKEILGSLIEESDASDKSESQPIHEPIPIQEPTPEPEPIPVHAPAPEPTPEPTPEPAPVLEPEPLAVPQPIGADLRKAFTINDRFRFRREIFGGDDKAMMDVIARLSEAQTFADAKAYLDTLAWDSDNEAVGEFKEIVSTFFNGYRI